MSLQDHRALRGAFGSYMTGVTVVTTLTGEGVPVGFTANSFTSVSLDPPLLLVCPGKSLSSFGTFARCTHFAVNVLEAHQKDVANIFASDQRDRFAKVSHETNAQGVPLIKGALVQFSCVTEQRIEAGDHLILIGRVETFAHTDGDGLGYASGRFFDLSSASIPA